MDIMGVSEAALRDNQHIVLFTVGGKSYATPLLSIAKASDWLERCEEADALDDAMQAGDRSKRREYLATIAELVYAYNPEALPKAEIEEFVSPAQMMAAFLKLRTLTDPFDMSQALAAATMEKQIGMLGPEAIRIGLSRMAKRPSSAD